MKPTEMQIAIMSLMREMQCHEDDGTLMDEFNLVTYDLLMRDFVTSRQRLCLAMKELRDEGLIMLEPSMNEDGQIGGSGWALTAKGAEFISDKE